jgi:predicted ATPase
MITRLAISGYRSLREVVLPLGRLTVVTGPNGSGKSSLYRALRLLALTAQGQVVRALAEEGGLGSTLWAGPEQISRAMRSGEHPVQGTRRSKPVALKLGFSGEDYGYAIDLGLPPPGGSVFMHDPAIKVEAMWTGETLGRANVFALRQGASVRIRDETGAWGTTYDALAPFDSMMTHCGDPSNGLELLRMREALRDWRFYDHFRTDAGAAARRPQVATSTPVLASDGSDLAAAFATINWIGDIAAFNRTVADAFDGARVTIQGIGGLVEIAMHQHGLLRPLGAAELSDGTLRYLLLACALLTPRPPPLMILNEPEASLHPDLLAPLARLILDAARRSQVVVVTHARALADKLEASGECVLFRLQKDLGETFVEGVERPSWTWPSR